MPAITVALTSDFVTASRMVDLLAERELHPLPLQPNMQVTHTGGEMGFRIEVPAEECGAAARALDDAGLGRWLCVRPDAGREAAEPAPAPELPAAKPVSVFEVAAVLCLTALPALFWALSAFIWPNVAPAPFAYNHFALLFNAIAWSVPVLYLISVSGHPWSHFGFVRPRVRDIGLGFVAVVATLGAYYVASAVAQALGFEPGYFSTFATPAGATQWSLFVVAHLANGFAEETVMRAYLLVRFRELTGSWPRTLFVTSLIFASYHCYQGVAGVYHIFVYGLVMALLFLAWRRIWPLALGHAAYNVLLVPWPE